jgi:c(7)-type cytochrome triheme protein
MKRAFALGALAALAFVTFGTARAVPPGLTIEFDGNGEGKVIFAGAQHTGKGMHCSNCHMEIFYVSRNSQITRADHRRHQACFVCHDGERAFAARSNCDRCHAEPEPEPQGPAPEAAAAVAP